MTKRNTLHLERSEQPQQKQPKRTEQAPQRRRKRPPLLNVEAILAHANDPKTDLLAEIETEIASEDRPEHPESAQCEEKQHDRQAQLDLTDLGTLRGLLRQHGLRPNKAFGQHLLVDREVLRTIVAAADLQSGENALEVGAGTGVLTVELAERARRVVAVELDQAILPVLHETTVRFTNVEIIPRDLLAVDPAEVFGAEPYKLVANLPYYITALTLRHFLENANPPRLLVVMVQKEVAERIVAVPGDMSLLALSVQFYGVPRIIAQVSAASFFPPPKVDSAIVRIDLLPEPSLQGTEREQFFRLAHAGFAERRKQVHNSLARNLHLPQEVVGQWLAAVGIDPMRRAETLSLEEWLRLTRVVLEGK